mgnify:CR=1 FL=1
MQTVIYPGYPSVVGCHNIKRFDERATFIANRVFHLGYLYFRVFPVEFMGPSSGGIMARDVEFPGDMLDRGVKLELIPRAAQARRPSRYGPNQLR